MTKANGHNRPVNLPDFEAPPLHEVVLGVQFAPPKGYNQIYAGDVWRLYSDDYPTVEERPALPPTFETFGSQEDSFRPMTNIQFAASGQHDRFWFINNEGTELIQFQQDRMLHNWRKVKNLGNPYPRYERMQEKFQNQLKTLNHYLHNKFSSTLHINQCEVSYINHIPFNPEVDNITDVLRVLNFEETYPSDFILGFRETIEDGEQRPYGRLLVEARAATAQDGMRIILLSLTVRGAPLDNTLNSALNFLDMGRSLIVNRFTAITTTSIHEKWGRTQ